MWNFVIKTGKTAKETGFVKSGIKWLGIILLSIV
jgi:hypothetical protein